MLRIPVVSNASNLASALCGVVCGAAAVLVTQRVARSRRAAIEAPAAWSGDNPGFHIEKAEEQMYKRFLQVQSRVVLYPDGRKADFDIVGHPRGEYKFTVVFVFHSSDRTVTLLREFAQAALPHAALVYGLVCGGYDPRKHISLKHAAECELSEEARLEGGKWTALLPGNDHPGVLESKWCRNRFTPFLCVDPAPAATPGSRDAEEYLSVMRVPVEQLKALLLGGQMLTPSLTTCVLALARLERGLIDFD